MRVDEGQLLRRLEGGPQRVEGRVVEAGAQPRGAEDEAFEQREGGEAVHFGDEGGGRRAHGEGAEGEEAPWVRGAEGVHVVVDGAGGGGGGGGGEEVEPGVGERDDGGGDGVLRHEGELGGDRGVGGVDGAAAGGGGDGGVVVGGQDDEAGWGEGGRGVWGWRLRDVRGRRAGGEQGDVGGGVDVRVDVHEEGCHGCLVGAEAGVRSEVVEKFVNGWEFF